MSKCPEEKEKIKIQKPRPAITEIKKEIQGSGKAAFPGEKVITDESPRMEEEELEMLEDFDNEEIKLGLDFKKKVAIEERMPEIIFVDEDKIDSDEAPIIDI